MLFLMERRSKIIVQEIKTDFRAVLPKMVSIKMVIIHVLIKP